MSKVCGCAQDCRYQAVSVLCLLLYLRAPCLHNVFLFYSALPLRKLTPFWQLQPRGLLGPFHRHLHHQPHPPRVSVTARCMTGGAAWQGVVQADGGRATLPSGLSVQTYLKTTLVLTYLILLLRARRGRHTGTCLIAHACSGCLSSAGQAARSFVHANLQTTYSRASSDQNRSLGYAAAH